MLAGFSIFCSDAHLMGLGVVVRALIRVVVCFGSQFLSVMLASDRTRHPPRAHALDGC